MCMRETLAFLFFFSASPKVHWWTVCDERFLICWSVAISRVLTTILGEIRYLRLAGTAAKGLHQSSFESRINRVPNNPPARNQQPDSNHDFRDQSRLYMSRPWETRKLKGNKSLRRLSRQQSWPSRYMICHDGQNRAFIDYLRAYSHATCSSNKSNVQLFIS